jgi:hypothetical protein
MKKREWVHACRQMFNGRMVQRKGYWRIYDDATRGGRGKRTGYQIGALAYKQAESKIDVMSVAKKGFDLGIEAQKVIDMDRGNQLKVNIGGKATVEGAREDIAWLLQNMDVVKSAAPVIGQGCVIPVQEKEPKQSVKKKGVFKKWRNVWGPEEDCLLKEMYLGGVSGTDMSRRMLQTFGTSRTSDAVYSRAYQLGLHREDIRRRAASDSNPRPQRVRRVIRGEPPKTYGRGESWTKDEDAKLKDMYVRGRSMQDIVDVLNRTSVGIRSRAKRLRIHRMDMSAGKMIDGMSSDGVRKTIANNKFRAWTKEEDDELRRLYPRQTAGKLSKQMKRTPYGIYVRAGILHLRKQASSNGVPVEKKKKKKRFVNKYAPWTKEADAEVMLLYGKGFAHAEIARTIGRTKNGVKHRVEFLRNNGVSPSPERFQ